MKTKPLTFLLTVILSFTCLTDNSFGFEQRQKEFLNIISSYAGKYTNTKNEMKKSLQRKKRSKAFKSFFASNLDFQNWEGAITSVDTDKDGDATVRINIGGVTLSNGINKIKLIHDLFDKVAEMKVGDKVVIEGSFQKHPETLSTGWYLNTSNPTEKGAMTSPTFMVGYGDIDMVGYGDIEKLSGSNYQCNVCMEYKGVEACREVKGREKQDTIMTGMSTACAAVTNGRMESINCSMTQPVKIQCR